MEQRFMIWPSLWNLPHYESGGYKTHLAKVTSLPNMAKWNFFIVLVILPSQSTKAKKIDEVSLVMYSWWQIYKGGRMNWSLEQIGLHTSLSISCSSVYNGLKNYCNIWEF